MTEIVDSIFELWLESGYLPFEQVITPDLVDRMTQAQFEAILGATEGGRETLMDYALDSER